MGVVFGGVAVELGGVVVRPDSQARKVGSRMLSVLMQSVEQDIITCHTRNPAILRMLVDVCLGEEHVYPLTPYNADLVCDIPGTTYDAREVAYHFGRYGSGLYGELTDDPANKDNFKYRYPGLLDPGTALVVAADFRDAKQSNQRSAQ